MNPSGDGGGALTAAELPCRSCGTELQPNSKFCNECGASVTQVSRSAEYKQVTVGVPATGVLVETLLDRRADVDVAEAEAAITRLAAAPTDDGVAVRDVWLLRLRALLARAHGDETAYRDYRDRYRAMATSLGFEGHIAWAEAMP